MQELKSITTASDPLLELSEQKRVSGLAYDPLGGAMFALSKSGGKSDQISAIVKIPDEGFGSGAAWEHHNQAKGAQQEEMKSKEDETRVPSVSNRQKSMASICGSVIEAAIEVNPSGVPQYLPPSLIPGSRASGKQIFTTDTYQEPDCLRFCPANSSDGLEISLSGFTVRAKAPGQVARTNKAFVEGVHYWEIICPLSLSTLLIGVSNKSQKEEVTQQFRTTTPRVLGIEMDLDKLTLNFWLNGRFVKERQKKLLPNQQWYPTIKFKEADYFVVINPFAQGRGFSAEEANSNYLPQILKTQETSLFRSFITSSIRGVIVAHGMSIDCKAPKTHTEIETEIRSKLQLEDQEAEIFFKMPSTENETQSVTFAVLKFANNLDAIEFYHNRKTLKLLHPRQVSNLMLPIDSNASPVKAQDKSDLPIAIASDLSHVVLTQVIPEAHRDEFKALSGLAVVSDTHKLEKLITSLKESLETDTIEKASSKTHNQAVDYTNIQYLNHSDKLLLTNGSELKLLSRAQNGQFPLSSAQTSFSLNPASINSEVRLELSHPQLTILLTHLDWSLLSKQAFEAVSILLDACLRKNTGDCILVPYGSALIAVKSLLNLALAQHELLESSFESLQEQEILHKFSPGKGNGGSAQPKSIQEEKALAPPIKNDISLPFDYGHISVIGSHMLLSVILDLEDQLWAMTLSDQVPSAVKDLWSQSLNPRMHTAYGRLASLITFPIGSQEGHGKLDVVSLSDLGLHNTNDKYGRLSHFQEFRTELENVFQNCSTLTPADIHASLERQFPNNLMLKGFNSWNVSLSQTLNRLPPQIHENGLSSENLTHQAISSIKVVGYQNFIMTGSSDGSINVWNTQTKLHRVGAHNFKGKLYQEELIDEGLLKELLLSKDSNESKSQDVKLILAGSQAGKQPADNIKSSVKLSQQSIQKAEKQASVEDILFTMFEEPEAYLVASAQSNHSSLEQAEPDSDAEVYEEQLSFLGDFYQPAPNSTVKKAQESLEASKEKNLEESKEIGGATFTASEQQIIQEKALAALNEALKQDTNAAATVTIVPDPDLLSQLQQMGFPLEACKKGLIKVKNESVPAAVDVIMEMQELESKVHPKEKGGSSSEGLQVLSYECTVCTYVNADGKAVCELCGTAAPQTAYVVVKSEEQIKREKDEAERQIKEAEEAKQREEERQQKEQEEARRIEEEEQLKKIQAEEAAKLKKTLKQKAKEYFSNAQVISHLFASVREGKDVKPLISGLVMKNTLSQTFDLHLARFAYRASYLRLFVRNQDQSQKPKCAVCDVPFPSKDKTIEHVLQCHKDIIEGLYPAFIGSQLSYKKWDTKVNRLKFHSMKSEHFATVVLPFEHLDHFCQIGTDVGEDTPLFILCIGRKAGQATQSLIFLRIELICPTSNELAITAFDQPELTPALTADLELSEIKTLDFDLKSNKLVVSTPSTLVTYKVTQEALSNGLNLKRDDSLTLNAADEETVQLVQQGVVYLGSKSNSVTIRRFLIDQAQISSLEQSINAPSNSLSSGSPILAAAVEGNKNQALNEEAILKMQVSPSQVTAHDIRRYEKLMSGKAVRALSNANNMMNADFSETLGKDLYTKHHWDIKGGKDIAPLMIEFERPTSLISLNVELSFTCRDTPLLVEQLKYVPTTPATTPSEEKSSLLEDTQIDTISSLKQTEAFSDTYNLGLLSLNGPSENGPLVQSQSDSTNSKGQSYLPLVVDHHKGASYNQTFQVCRVVMNNDKVFASNYPLPEFYFKHQHGHSMLIDKFTIRSTQTSKCGASPVGSGLIFTAENLSVFEKTLPFHRFTHQDYKEWHQLRLKDPSPLKPYEPIAYFEFESESAITCEPDYQRLCKYIFLKPTGFRKKGSSGATGKVNLVPLEIEFFGASGSSQELYEGQASTGQLTDSDASAGGSHHINSGYDLELRVLNDKRKVLKTLKGVEIQSLFGFDLSVSPKTAASWSFEKSKGNLVGKTNLKITDSHLQLEEVKGLEIVLRKNGDESSLWQIRGLCLQGIVAGKDQGMAAPLFGTLEIPLSYMRSCLLSPKFYNVVNRVLVKMAWSDQTQPQLRNAIIQFLTKIIKLNRDFGPLVCQDIDLGQFLKINLFFGEASAIQLVVEFLQNFQSDAKFCQQLYSILLNYVDSLPEKLLQYHGYEALIGMLKWAVPINPEMTLTHVLKALYQEICLKKVPALQTPEYIQFRSRSGFSTFPFDVTVFKNSKQALQAKRESQLSTFSSSANAFSSEGSSKQLLPVTQITRVKHEAHHIFDIQMAKDGLVVTDLKLFISVPQNAEGIQYKLIVKIFGETGNQKDTLLYLNTFDEQIFTQFVQTKKTNQATTLSNNESLHIPYLSLTSQKFRVVIEFGVSFTSLPRNSPRASTFDTLLEIYGHSNDVNDTQTSLKGLLDKQAQDFWMRSGKLYSIGGSVKMLQIVNDSSESLFVPQGILPEVSCAGWPSIDLTVTDSGTQQVTIGEGGHLQATSSQDSTSHVVQKSQNQHLLSELAMLQEELKGKLRAGDPNIKEIVDKIAALQQNLEYSQQNEATSTVVPSLEYYMTVSSDFIKIISQIIKGHGTKLSSETVSRIFRSVANDNENLSHFGFEIFKRFIVYDQGPQIKQGALGFISECMYSVMTKEEKRSMIFKIIEEFLASPQSNFSQMAVLESLNTLGIPEGELISFMKNKMQISAVMNQPVQGVAQPLKNIQPFVFMSSVLILALDSLRKISIPEPGLALHKGVPCSGCHTKHIVGWRYKCGHCPGDVDFDQKCSSNHLSTHPNHVMIIIQEPLPYKAQVSSPLKLAKGKKSKGNQSPILPSFAFIDPPQEPGQALMPHNDVNCENCGTKPVLGSLFKCANCEDYNLCEQCYTKGSFEHFSYHIFMQFHRPLKTLDKSPTTLLQVLDPRLYPQRPQDPQLASSTNLSPLMKKDQPLEEYDSDDLVPLSVARSYSVPMSQKVKKSDVGKQQGIASTQPAEEIYVKLDCDQQFVSLFTTCVWITQDSQSQRFSREEKIVLLKLLIETLLELIKLTNVKQLLQVVQNKENFFQLLVAILQLNSPGLLNLFKSLLDQIRQPPTLQRMLKEEKLVSQKQKPDAKVSEKKQQLIDDSKTVKVLLESLITHIQAFLKWLIELGIEPEMAKLQASQGQESWNLLLQSYTNQRIWLDQLSFILDLFIKCTDEAKEHRKTLYGLENSGIDTSIDKIPEETDIIEEEEELAPLSVSRSVSLPLTPGQLSKKGKPENSSLLLIKSLVSLLHMNESNPQQALSSKSSLKTQHMNSYFKETESQTKYLSLMWSMVLKSLTAVSVNQLIEAKIFDALVQAFLISTEEIKQITYPQILQITEIIATQSVHTSDISRFICNLLFLTLESVTDNHHEKVGYSICQAWLDILISSTIARPSNIEASNTVHAKMSGEELSVYIKKTSHYLVNYLNKCSFEGVTGSNMNVMMRLNLAADLLYVIRYSQNKNKPGQLAIQDLFAQVQKNPKIRKDFQESMSCLLAWLLLNARQAKDDQITSQLGNSSTLTPATAKVKQMTEYIEEIFSLLAESESCEEAVKVALSSMTQIVKKLNKTYIDLVQNKQLGYDVSVRLSERTNDYFIRLLGQWLVSDSIASYFVFDLGGFEFLLDTIGVGSEIEGHGKRKSSDQLEEMKQIDTTKVSGANHDSQFTQSGALSALGGSDIAKYLESKILEIQSTKPAAEQTALLNKEPSIIQAAAPVEKQPVFVQEFSKNMTMVWSNGGDVVSQYAKTDWSVNKRMYKHRIIIKHLQGPLRPEYALMFQLQSPVELREIQIAFTNFWAADTEVYAEPLSVLVEAGMDENNLSLVCNLQIAKDDAFGSVSATVYGQNLQSFSNGQTPLTTSIDHIEDMIQQKLSSLQNFQVQYLKFRMRRHVLTCLENSPLSTKFNKQAAFAINYISLLGLEISKLPIQTIQGDLSLSKHIKQEQKRTALEALSLICSGDFASILKVIANQPHTIEKLKRSFSLLASLVEIKANLIEPTFIAISTYNTDMGDWIINQFLKGGARNPRHASLVGEIVICNKVEMPRRLNLMKDFVMNQLIQVTKEERSQHGTLIKKVVPFVKVFIQTLRIAAPDLEATSQCYDLGTKESYLSDILQLLSGATQEREQQTKILTQLMVLLLCPPAPFINRNIDAYTFTLKYLLDDQGNMTLAPTISGHSMEENLYQRENIASILSAARTQIAQEILERGFKLDKLLQPGKGSERGVATESSSNLQLQHNIRFWINVAQDQQVRLKLAKDKIPLKLYDVLRSEVPEKTQKIVRADSVINEQELELMVELIKQLTAGTPELEKELASLLMKDLDYMSNIRDMDFVNKVFLPLLRIEKTVPICLWPYDSEAKKWLSSFKPSQGGNGDASGLGLSGGSTLSNQMAHVHNNFVPSALLQGEKRSVFIKNFKEIVGQHSKGGLKKLLGSTWTLAHSQTQQSLPPTQFQSFWKSIEEKSPIVVLISCQTSTGSSSVYGCYCSKGVPSVPSNMTQDSDYPISSAPEDFAFCYVDDNSFHHFAPKASIPIISMFTDYEGGGAISVANDFMLMSYSQDFTYTVGTLYDLDKIQQDANGHPAKDVPQGATFQKFEVWSVQPQSAVTLKEAAAGTLHPKSVFGLSQVSCGENAADSIKHAWYNPMSPYVHFRTNPVFMVPAHLTLSQLSKIMLESSVSFKPRSLPTSSLASLQTEILDHLFTQLEADSGKREQANGIIDLEYDTNQILSVGQADKQGVEEVTKEAEESASGESTGIISGYVPKMGLFEQFEEQGGVKEIIHVTLQSLKLWKAEEQAKSWELWLRELESFSEIPLFFQLFLKNTRCKDLLFKVLAGLPDSEISSDSKGGADSAKGKWEEEQKAAVQFNYKILSEAFSISSDTKLRDTAMKCGLLPRILDRLAQISGEKPRTFDDDEVNEASGTKEAQQQQQSSSNQMSQSEKNVDKKKRKGVGYSSKVGVTFNVTQYLENKKLRNEQIKNLVDICSSFVGCKEWTASTDVLSVVLESALLPLLESAFRNGSWLDMAKEHEVYHSYLALARAFASQKNLAACLVKIDPKYKPSQTEPIYKLLQKLNDLAEIFINCLNQQTKADHLKGIPFQKQQLSQAILIKAEEPQKEPILVVSSTQQNLVGELVLPQNQLTPEKADFEPLEFSWPNLTIEQFLPIQLPQSNITKLLPSKNPSQGETQIIGGTQHEELMLPSLPMTVPDAALNHQESVMSLLNASYKNLEEQKKEAGSPSVLKSPLNSPSSSSSNDDGDQFLIPSILSKKGWPWSKNEKGVTFAKTANEKAKELFDNSSKPSALSDAIKQNLTSSGDKWKQAKLKNPPLGILAETKKKPGQLFNDASSSSSSSSSYQTLSEHTVIEEVSNEEKEDDDDDFETFSEESYYSAKETSAKKSALTISKTKGKTKQSKPLKKKISQAKQVSISEHYNEEDDSKESQSSSSIESNHNYESSESSQYKSSDYYAAHDVSDGVSSQSAESDNNEDDEDEDGSDSGTSLYSEESDLTADMETRDREVSKGHQEIDSEIPENLARDVIKTYAVVQAAVQKLLKNQKDENYIENALNLPAPQAYKVLLQDLRFDYMDMKDAVQGGATLAEAHYKHHYQQVAAQNQNPPPSKMVRLAQELADLSNALPYEHTNAIFVRVDQARVDLMKALICGAANTPYAHGCYEYDIFCDNNYPREPPKMNLITTGSGSVRFNPNLYACGKVCLSLLGTWRGSATENWDPKLSTILQVLLSTQAIIMSEEVYFNEPGFENEAGTPEGEKKNEGYQNIVRYCNIKFAMLAQIKKPSKGFEQVIKRHFYIKKEEILKEVNHWVELAEKNEAAYNGLVNDHNYNWANQFKASKTKYKEMLSGVVQELTDELNKLERPTDYELKLKEQQEEQMLRKRQKGAVKRQAITEGKAELAEIDMATDEEDAEGDDQATEINTESKGGAKPGEKVLSIEDEAVKDRWSRYIGAMGIEAVAKQASASIFLSGAGALGIEIAKNLVLAGCKSFTLHDYKPISYRDLSGQFFLNLEEDILNEKKKKSTRGEACLPRLKQLNYYVKCSLAPVEPLPIDNNMDKLKTEPWNLQGYDVIILTEASHSEIAAFDSFCRETGKKLIVADAYGVFTRVFNDFGPKFEVLDKNGEELQDVMIKSIENDSDEALVELLPHTKHKFEDGDEVIITGVDGMKAKEGQGKSINETIHKVKVLTPYSFKIGSTKGFDVYERNGIARQLKTKKVMEFKSFEEVSQAQVSALPLDANLAVADFEKMANIPMTHLAFDALDLYKLKNNQALPSPWDRLQTQAFLDIAKELLTNDSRYKDSDLKWEAPLIRFLALFGLTSAGVFNPLCAFQGGVVAQEVVKAITQKFSPICQLFYYDAYEVLPPEFDYVKHWLASDFDLEKWAAEEILTKEIKHRSDGLRIILGGEMIQRLSHTRLFMVGAGAIGCELLKNFAMLGVGTGKADSVKNLQSGAIVLTDPDVIEVSNLNRQFLFREKHLRNPKSSTAAAAAVYMNRELKDNIIARLDKVHEGTAHIFTDQFFEELSVVTNALDNVHARRYIDARCVIAKTPLLESGTLGPKGHVQVVLPHKTESYGSMNDPEDNTEIPHCTLKMFPEETLHCVEWARDKFGKLFTQAPQNAVKLLDEGDQFEPTSQEDTKSLREVVKLLEKRPLNFADCLSYARLKFEKLFNHDIRQLLHVYPLDSKTKEGAPFWSLPKRPPTPIEFDANNILHCQFINSIACLRANVFKIEIPSQSPRHEDFKKECGLQAYKVIVPAFIPNDEKAKEIQASVNKEAKDKEAGEEEKSSLEEPVQINTGSSKENDLDSLLKRFKILLTNIYPPSTQKSCSIIAPELFEKDNDQNFHIDAIYAMGNCRASNYKLDLMDWITVKLKAGRIVPALATTTAAVAGLQTLELVKLLRGCKKTDHRNVFLNLAVPIMQASEPGDVAKSKLAEGLEVTLWDRWEVRTASKKEVTLGEFIEAVQGQIKAHNLEVRDVMRGNAPLFFHAIMSGPGKEAERAKALESKVTDLAGIDTSEDKYVDLNITCVLSSAEDQQVISGVPPVRVYFE